MDILRFSSRLLLLRRLVIPLPVGPNYHHERTAGGAPAWMFLLHCHLPPELDDNIATSGRNSLQPALYSRKSVATARTSSEVTKKRELSLIFSCRKSLKWEQVQSGRLLRRNFIH